MAIKIRIVSDFDNKGITEANKALNNLSNAAGLALAAVGAAMVGIGVASVREFAKFDAALVKSQAIMGDLSDALKNDMANAAREVAKVTTFSAEQAAESYFFLASAGLDAESSIKALPQVAQFAQAGMFDMARATDLLTDAQSALGLTIRDDAVANMKNMIQVSDVLVRANTLANASVEQFSVALTTKAGAALRDLGKDVEEGVAVLAAFADQGIKGELAGTQLAIVLRDLTTRAIKNKDEFAKMNIGVFDAAGNMNNLGDIVSDLESALEGMSDETRKATLMQLGFSDKSLASLMALMGTSEAIKSYEKELRSASGFTESVATKQLDSFEAQVKLLESAFIDVAIQIGEELTPHLKSLIPVLQRLLPEIGEKMAKAVAQVDWAKLAENVANFFIAFVENIDTIVKVATNIGILAAALVTYTTGVRLAAIATAIWTGTLILNPIIAAATAILALAAAIAVHTGNAERNKLTAQSSAYQTRILKSEIDQLNQAYKVGAIDTETYERQLRAMQQQMNSAAISTDATAGELRRFNNLRLDGAIASMNAYKNATSLAERQARSFSDSYAYLESIGAVTSRTPSRGTGSLADEVAGGGGGPSAFETARKKVTDLIRSSQKQIQDAQKTLVTAQLNARKNYAENIERIEKDFANRLVSIVSQSQDRLRQAYRGAVEENIAALFDRSEDKSIEGLVKSLSDKLKGSRQLLANSAQLASQGFSQTFIEQIVSAGVETGNELAGAILNSTPEVRSELKSLFSQIESEASTGMDSLARQIYTEQGLATQELKNLYAQTQNELSNALLEQQVLLDRALVQANDTFVDSVTRVKEALADQLREMNGQFGGMERTINQFMGKLDELINKYRQLQAVSGAPLAPMPAPSVSTPSPAIGFQPIPTVTPRPTVSIAPQPIVNVNVKTDSTQSTAMVGKAVAKAVNKYTGGGGGLRGISVIAL
jgi:TP901 family phage tail tape measure protein